MENDKLQRGIIGCVLYETDLADKLIEEVKEKHFDNTIANKSYKWIRNKIMKGEKINKAEFMREVGRVDQFIVDEVNTIEFEHYLDILKKDYTRSKIAEVSKQIYNLTKKEDLNVDELQAQSQDMIFRASDNTTQKGEYSLGEALETSFEDFTRRMNNEGEVQGIKTGIPVIDGKLGGLWAGHLYTIGGDTSMGKTAYAISLMLKLLKNGNSGSIISLEMNHSEIIDRLVSIDSRVSATDFSNGRLTETQQKSLNLAYNRLDEYSDRLKISDERGLSVENIKAKCRKQKRELDGLDFVIIDYLTMIRRSGDKSQHEEIGEVVLGLRNMAQEIDAPVFVLSQTNRSNPNQRPTVHSLRSSGWIEEISDSIWLVWRPNRFDDRGNQIRRQEAELIRAKERTGQPGIDKYYFYPQITFWRDGYLEDVEGEEPITVLTRKNT